MAARPESARVPNIQSIGLNHMEVLCAELL